MSAPTREIANSCPSITECLLKSVTEDTILAAKGPIPWRYVASRIVNMNPGRSTMLRTGGWGGLAMTSIADAMVRQIDIRDPWTSVFHLFVRYREIVARRIIQYASVFDPIFGDQATFASASFGKKLWAPCTKNPGASAFIPLREMSLRSQGVVKLCEFQPLEGDDLRYLGGHSYCSTCPSGSPLSTSLEDAITSIIPTGDSSGDNSDVVRCDNPFSSFAVFSFGDPSSWRSKSGSSKPPIGWPRILLRDPGFWALVLFEEMVTHYTGSAGTVTANKIWEKIVREGITGLVPDQVLRTVIANELVYSGKFYIQSPFFAVKRWLKANPKVYGEATDSSQINLYLDKAYGIVENSATEGSAGFSSPNDIDIQGADPTRQIVVQQFGDTLAKWSSSSRSWAGVLGDVPDVAEGTDPLLRSTIDTNNADPLPLSSGMNLSTKILLLGGVVVLVGFLLKGFGGENRVVES